MTVPSAPSLKTEDAQTLTKSWINHSGKAQNATEIVPGTFTETHTITVNGETTTVTYTEIDSHTVSKTVTLSDGKTTIVTYTVPDSRTVTETVSVSGKSKTVTLSLPGSVTGSVSVPTTVTIDGSIFTV